MKINCKVYISWCNAKQLLMAQLWRKHNRENSNFNLFDLHLTQIQQKLSNSTKYRNVHKKSHHYSKRKLSTSIIHRVTAKIIDRGFQADLDYFFFFESKYHIQYHMVVLVHVNFVSYSPIQAHLTSSTYDCLKDILNYSYMNFIFVYKLIFPKDNGKNRIHMIGINCFYLTKKKINVCSEQSWPDREKPKAFCDSNFPYQSKKNTQ